MAGDSIKNEHEADMINTIIM